METYRCPMLKTGESKMGLFKDIKSAFKGSKEYQKGKAKKKAVKAKKKEGKTWTKAVKKQKKAGGSSMSNLIKRRNAAKKGSEAYAKAQNAINEAYGSKKVHKADAPKKADKKKVAPKGPPGPGRDAIDYGQDIKITKSPGQKFEKGGKVEGNPYGWPTKDSRNR